MKTARGVPRFLLYLIMQLLIFVCPWRWIAVPAVLLCAVSYGEYKTIRSVFRLIRSWQLALMAALPALVALPDALTSDAFWELWSQPLLKSARFFLVFASAAWFSGGMTHVDMRDTLIILLKPLGHAVSKRIARSAALVMAFLPWTKDELATADEAVRIRGCSPKKKPARYLAALAIPLIARSFAKAKHSSEALALRDPDFWA